MVLRQERALDCAQGFTPIVVDGGAERGLRSTHPNFAERVVVVFLKFQARTQMFLGRRHGYSSITKEGCGRWKVFAFGLGLWFCRRREFFGKVSNIIGVFEFEVWIFEFWFFLGLNLVQFASWKCSLITNLRRRQVLWSIKVGRELYFFFVQLALCLLVGAALVFGLGKASLKVIKSTLEVVHLFA